ncbi:MAG: hypothetical protein DRR15_09810 [Gammaproteobacteria bacterium]|nr:MAG: hypothetical protein DRR15_09810 [Gammaproteobacteria bacterium]
MNLTKQKQFFSFAALTLVLGLGACNEDSKTATSVTAEKVESTPVAATISKPAVVAPAASSASPGKPSAPISMKYEILGNPVVGQPVAINVEVRSTSGNHPVTVQYSINDSSALVFQAGQVERLQVTADAEKTASLQQLAVIPQREGRLYVNVSAEIQTPDGTMIKSMAIPIQVGSAPAKPEINGELVEGPDGETVISMPAKEN